ncbi:ABC transporter permease [Halobacteria archaeon AArc-m2/3/4]|uniref:ABC transporter permease n=1 Tax=Natronoglomus mannanivorans TaxID=2979990 RepID=A0AAP2Z305_9EURY|nr:ABC transporter permease [Halobacteria archaeon AArc-xg1-1]MCU4974066.1 ABC transporter permease [Halobacteria archaeon AArc-m2/3/4]
MPGGPREYLQRQLRQNPMQYGLPEDATEQDIQYYLDEFLVVPPDRTIYEAFFEYMINIHQGDFGVSYIYSPGTPVVELIAAAAPWTIFISSIAMVYMLVATILFGSFMAYYEGTKFDMGMTIGMLFNGGIPYYIVAIILLYFVGYQLEWFPTGGRYNTEYQPGYNLDFIGSAFYHAVLPSLSFILTGFGASALSLRAHAIRILGEDYIRAARIRGLSSYKISTRYLARNSLLPMWTSIMIGLSGLLGGAVIMETIFAYQGMGLLMFEATIARDFPLLTANLVLITFMFVLGTILADLTYALIDPRAEQASMG